MEIEKPFKCSNDNCTAQFTTEDHLSVHRKRHEMCLNLKPGQSSHQLDSFADETPTPTRFLRNCEEVGLFQDLQNVNPFDEQFAKAANSTPNPGTDQFDFSKFSIGLPSASIISTINSNNNASSEGQTSTSKRRYSDQDTLNTPQIFGYIITTSSGVINSASTVMSSVLNPMPSTNEIGKDYIIPKKKAKTALKLNLSPIIVNPSFTNDESDDTGDNSNSSYVHILDYEDDEPDETKKIERLVKNRASAARSRARRKQWVQSLETKCIDLEKLLRETKDELLKERAENHILRNELSKHEDCEVTKNQSTTLTEARVQEKLDGRVQIILVQQPKQDSSQSSQGMVPPIIITHDPESAAAQNVLVAKSPPKRGRPRKGDERSLPISERIFKPTTNSANLPKIPISPITKLSKFE